MSDSMLKELWQQVAEKKSCEAKQKELTAQRNALADRLKKLEKTKLAEQADVDRLGRSQPCRIFLSGHRKDG